MFTNYGAKDFQSYISTLHQMKLDLEFIFKRIRTIKTKLEQKYPQYYSDGWSQLTWINFYAYNRKMSCYFTNDIVHAVLFVAKVRVSLSTTIFSVFFGFFNPNPTYVD